MPSLAPSALLGLSFLIFTASVSAGDAGSAPVTTRQRTIRPLALGKDTPPANPCDVALYKKYGYSVWRYGPGEDQGRRLDLAPAGYTGSPNSARLVSFFSMSDIHITDKESPAQVPWFGWSAPFGSASVGLYAQAYSPNMTATIQVLDAAVRTVNRLHVQSRIDFGLILGDTANSSQYNEVRWFIDVLDGKFIEPSSGAHIGAESIAYQKPFKAEGLNRDIPWYEVIGNHDQFWMGVLYPTAKLRKAMVADTVLNIGPRLFAPYNSEETGVYVGVLDCSSPVGPVIKGGPQENFSTVPRVVADPARHCLLTEESFVANYIAEFSKSTSLPVGHGFSSSTSACYSFVPKSDLPLKVIVLDDTCKSKGPSGSPAYFGKGWIDEERYNWLLSELQAGQDADQLMIIACHIPINPQKDLFDTRPLPQFYKDSFKTEPELIAALNRFPNLLMVMAGHRHLNTVTPMPSPDPAHPEYGFWQVETASLRDFPKQFRLFELRRNADNTLSIITTDVDPQTEPDSPAAEAVAYSIGAYRIYGNGALGDDSSHVYNAELVKVLTPRMQSKIAGCGVPLPKGP